jgi:hypothetical protein
MKSEWEAIFIYRIVYLQFATGKTTANRAG